MLRRSPLYRLRKSRGLTQESVAKKLGISKNYLSVLECGTLPVTTKMEERLAKVYGISREKIRRMYLIARRTYLRQALAEIKESL